MSFTGGNLYDHHCEHCGAFLFPVEWASASRPCCGNGNVLLPRIPELDPQLLRLFTSDTPAARYFRENIRAFNSAYAFASFVCREAPVPGSGIQPFRVNGTTFHKIGALEALPGNRPAFMQMYFIDDRLQRHHGHTQQTNLSARQDPP